MRTKALLGLIALAASSIAALAQSNVYSLNVVGYVNVPVTANKFYMLGNPLNASGGNNAITNVLQLDDTWDGTTIYPWTASGFGDAEAYYAGFGWFPGTTVFNPGSGFFIQPTKSGTLTFVGEVVTTNNFNLPSGFTMTSSAFPSGSTSLVGLGLIGQDGDTVYRFDPIQGYLPATAYYGGYGWYDSAQGDGGPVTGPNLNVAEGVFYYNANSTVHWTQNFTIQ